MNVPEIKEIFHEDNVVPYEDKTIKVLRFIFRDLYVARHLGRYGEMINVPKIRTMCLNAKLKEVIKTNSFAKDDKPKDDPRIIPSKRWLKRFFLDEIPQIPYNVTSSVG